MNLVLKHFINLAVICALVLAIAACSDDASKQSQESKPDVDVAPRKTALHEFAEQLLSKLLDGQSDWSALIGTAAQFKQAYELETGDQELVDPEELASLHAMVTDFIPNDCAQVLKQQQELWKVDWSEMSLQSAEILDETMRVNVSAEGRQFGFMFDGVVSLKQEYIFIGTFQGIFEDGFNRPLINRKEVSGILLLDDKPLVGAHVVFQPDRGTRLPFAFDQTDAEGRFVLQTSASHYSDGEVLLEKVVPGKYLVRINQFVGEGFPNEIPEGLLVPGELPEVDPLSGAGSGGGENKLSDVFDNPAGGENWNNRITVDKDLDLTLDIHSDGSGEISFHTGDDSK